MKKVILLGLLLGVASYSTSAQAPSNYYNNADSLTGAELRLALRDIIKDHTVISYGGLWNTMRTSDVKANGKVWDMYSDVPNGPQNYEYTFVSDQCGNYGVEGDCYNREHTWPQSKFNRASPMVSDLGLIVPTDGYVNGRRDSHPFGVVDRPTWTSSNGSKLGPNAFPGASGTAFEPIDEYKGDFARMMFYVVTRYYKQDSNWEVWEMATKAELTNWALAMFLEWHYNDPVSDKERDRNDVMYRFQRNRNPFIDNPIYVDCIWNLTNCPYTGSGGNEDPNPPTGINDLTVSNYVKIFPNPANGILNLAIAPELISEVQSINIQSIQGQNLKSINGAAISNYSIDVVEIPSGIYFVQINTNKGISIKKFVKN